MLDDEEEAKENFAAAPAALDHIVRTLRRAVSCAMPPAVLQTAQTLVTPIGAQFVVYLSEVRLLFVANVKCVGRGHAGVDDGGTATSKTKIIDE